MSLTKIKEILEGIDQTEEENEKGFWETSTGAEHGAFLLKKIEQVFQPAPHALEIGGMRVQNIAPTFWAKIFIAGPIEQAKNLLRGECMAHGLCVTIEPTLYIYTGGEEAGYVVGLINYPRFPSTREDLIERAVKIAYYLMSATFQRSCTVQTPLDTYFIQNAAYRP